VVVAGDVLGLDEGLVGGDGHRSGWPEVVAASIVIRGGEGKYFRLFAFERTITY
jgi:hypothetical protein